MKKVLEILLNYTADPPNVVVMFDPYPLIRPLLFLLPPEAAHAATLAILGDRNFAALFSRFNKFDFGRTTSAALPGLFLRNVFGLAAGADKNASALAGWDALGFGFVEIGTVTPRPQKGNPPPRLWRFPCKDALVNALGFPNDGADAVAARLRHWREKHPRGSGMLVGVNCGKQKETPLRDAVRDYLHVIETCGAFADFIVINVSSPNTPGLRALQTAETIYPLVLEIVQACAADTVGAGSSLPVWVKISPDIDDVALVETADAIARAGAAAVVATNTTVDHSPLACEIKRGSMPGGMSGKPLFERSLRCVQRLQNYLCGRLPIVACGGISSPDHVRAYVGAGATLLELYTALVFQGPFLLRKLAR